jgi:glycosyltransferase involved in cell wall biosynthesis
MTNKNIAIVIHNLEIGGVQKALLEFANKLSLNNNITIFLIKKKGLLIDFLSKKIEIVFLDDKTSYYTFVSGSKRKDLTGFSDKVFKLMINIAQVLKFEFIFFRLFTTKILKKFDVAISYTGRPGIWDYIVKSQMTATYKLAWIHNDPFRLGLNKINIYRYYKKFNQIFNVSYDCMNKLNSLDKRIRVKNHVMYNLVNIDLIHQKAKQSEHLFDSNRFNIVTVTRLQLDSKRIDRIVDVCLKLIRNGTVNFRWHIVGDGPYYEQLKNDIKLNKIDDFLILHGFSTNPYSFIYQSDIFCLVSDYEGLPLTIMEAKVLKKPIISTNVDSIKELVENGVNGLIVEKNTRDIYLAIRKVIENTNFFNELIYNASKFDSFAESDINYFYDIMQKNYEK